MQDRLLGTLPQPLHGALWWVAAAVGCTSVVRGQHSEAGVNMHEDNQMEQLDNTNHWPVPSTSITAIDVAEDGIFVATQDAVWRCKIGQDDCLRLGVAPHSAEAHIDQVVNGPGGQPWIVSWGAEGQARISRWTEGAWQTLDTAEEPRVVVPGDETWYYGDTSNRLHRVHQGRDEILDKGPITDIRTSADGSQLVGLRPDDNAVLVTDLPLEGAPNWQVVVTGASGPPAGILTSGEVALQQRTRTVRGEPVPNASLVASGADGRRDLWTGRAMGMKVSGTTVAYVTLDADGVPQKVARAELR
jgi:hypothetical protein